MLFQIDPRSPDPVYQQIVDQVKQAVVAGALRPGDQLPPIRDAAVDVRANRNTVARAYIELEREGVIYTQVGRGAFVSGEAVSLCSAQGRVEVRRRLEEVIALALRYGVPPAEVGAWVREIAKDAEGRTKAKN